MLNLSPRNLSFIIYRLNGGREAQYYTFEIPKRRGGVRTISAPNTALKEIQSRLNDVLLKVYWEKPCVHSFVENRSIKTNALKHCHKRFVANIDLKDFFPSINFGRVRGLFMSGPYNLPSAAATVLAQIACYKNALPQGSPCSPIISNMICSKLDSELIRLAQKYQCYYSRYADDLTFSTNLKSFPHAICVPSDDNHSAGDELSNIIKNNGFEINLEKIRVQHYLERQEVTGLIVNEFVNTKRTTIRQVQAMLHAWSKFGLEEAQREHYEKYSSKKPDVQCFKDVLRGKIEFISSISRNNARKQIAYKKKFITKEDISLRLLKKYFELEITDNPLPLIITEGPTDWMHLSAALTALQEQGYFTDLSINFYKNQHEIMNGESNIIHLCEKAKLMRKRRNKVICLFDKDIPKVNKLHNGIEFKKWSKDFYSFVLPDPEGFNGKFFSIEMYYGTKFLLSTYDSSKRRLYLSSEFNEDQSHKLKHKVFFGISPKTGKNISSWKETIKGPEKVLDSHIVRLKDDKKYISIALTKKRFALNIMKKDGNFSEANFDEFKKIFTIIQNILHQKE